MSHLTRTSSLTADLVWTSTTNNGFSDNIFASEQRKGSDKRKVVHQVISVMNRMKLNWANISNWVITFDETYHFIQHCENDLWGKAASLLSKRMQTRPLLNLILRRGAALVANVGGRRTKIHKTGEPWGGETGEFKPFMFVFSDQQRHNDMYFWWGRGSEWLS